MGRGLRALAIHRLLQGIDHTVLLDQPAPGSNLTAATAGPHFLHSGAV